MGRALGINALANAAFESTYGTSPGSGYTRLPFVSHSLGEERGLIASDLLGYGREPRDPVQDVANNRGDIVVPVDQRAFGLWLKLLMGPPVTAAYGAANGSISFSAQPAATATVTIAGTAFTAVASGATGNQFNIGVNLAATMTNLATVLNASVISGVAAATYTAAPSGLLITHDTLGPVGNSFTFAASTNSNATVLSGTLLGGTNAHTFTSGASALPSMSLEIGNPEVPNYSTHYGIGADTMRIGMSRSGLLNATVGLIAQGESSGGTTSTAGSVATLAVSRFAQAVGSIKRAGVEIGGVVDGSLEFGNGLDPVETIRADGRIDGTDPGIVAPRGSFTAKFADRTVYDIARSNVPVALSYGWSSAGGSSLIFNFPRVFLPVPKRPITGPAGIQAAYDWQASGEGAASMTAVLTNDLAGSVYA